MQKSALAVLAVVTFAVIVAVVFSHKTTPEKGGATAQIANSLSNIQEQLADLRGRQVALENQLATALKTPASADSKVAAKPAPAGQAVSPPVARRDEALRAQEAGQAILGAAEQAGKWTDADREKMRAVFGAADDEARFALLSELGIAVNQGRLKLALQGSPL